MKLRWLINTINDENSLYLIVYRCTGSLSLPRDIAMLQNNPDNTTATPNPPPIAWARGACSRAWIHLGKLDAPEGAAAWPWPPWPPIVRMGTDFNTFLAIRGARNIFKHNNDEECDDFREKSRQIHGIISSHPSQNCHHN